MISVPCGQWWNAPPDEIFRAYYLCLRTHYEMPALEAYATARANFAKYPDFFNNPMECLRKAINHDRGTL